MEQNLPSPESVVVFSKEHYPSKTDPLGPHPFTYPTGSVDMLTDIMFRQGYMNRIAMRDDEHLLDAITQGVTDIVDGKPVYAKNPVGDWLRKYTHAMQEECSELMEEFPWKWWSKDPVDIQNARVEAIDILHFLTSIFNLLGMSPKDVHELYLKKWETNIERQRKGYSKATKDETDNKGLVVGMGGEVDLDEKPIPSVAIPKDASRTIPRRVLEDGIQYSTIRSLLALNYIRESDDKNCFIVNPNIDLVMTRDDSMFTTKFMFLPVINNLGNFMSVFGGEHMTDVSKTMRELGLSSVSMDETGSVMSIVSFGDKVVHFGEIDADQMDGVRRCIYKYLITPMDERRYHHASDRFEVADIIRDIMTKYK